MTPSGGFARGEHRLDDAFGLMAKPLLRAGLPLSIKDKTVTRAVHNGISVFGSVVDKSC